LTPSSDLLFTVPSNVIGFGVGASVEVGPLGNLIISTPSIDLKYLSASENVLADFTSLGEPSITTGGKGTIRFSSDGLRLIGNGRMLDLP